MLSSKYKKKEYILIKIKKDMKNKIKFYKIIFKQNIKCGIISKDNKYKEIVAIK